MSEAADFRHRGEIVDSDGRTWQVDHDFLLPTAAGQGRPLTTPVAFTRGKERFTARTVARSALSDAEYLALLETQQAKRRAAEGGGE